MVVMMGVTGRDLVEVAVRSVTGGVFHLNGAVRNGVMVLQKVLNTPQ